MLSIFSVVLFSCNRNKQQVEQVFDITFSSILNEISTILDSDSVYQDEYEPGGWLVVNQPVASCSKEFSLIEDRPKKPSDVKYVLVVSYPKKVEVGFQHYPGIYGGKDIYISEYTLKLFDWPKKQLIDVEEIQSIEKPEYCRSSYGHWYNTFIEKQNKYRPSIVAWLTYRGIIKEDYRCGDYPEETLEKAILDNNIKLMEFLINKGYSVDGRYWVNSGYSYRPIRMALAIPHPEIAQILIKHGAKEDVLSYAGLGDLKKVKELIDLDSTKINYVSDYNYTPLHYAVINGKSEVVRFLLSKGADIKIKSNGGRTPFDIALIKGDTAIIHIFSNYLDK
jgi:hypothetical protein